ncbi:MAG: hypothetical protein WC295_10905 [Methanoregula sp.]
MHGFVNQEINRYYSSFDGWKILPVKNPKGYDQVFCAERSKMGEKESVSILVSFEPKIPFELASSTAAAGTGAYGQVKKGGVAYIVPRNADTTGVPEGARLLYMKSFSFQNGILTWEKNPVRRPVAGKETPVSN